MNLLVGVRLVIETPDGNKIHTRAIEVREHSVTNILEAALEASHAAFELAFAAFGREITPHPQADETEEA